LRPGRDGRRRRRPGHLGPVAPAARDRRPMTHDRTRRHARARRIGALAGALLVLAAPASGVGERGPREPEQGRYLRLHAGPTEHLLSPGEAVRWEVEVALGDPPSAAGVAVAVGLAGSLLYVPGALALTFHWCRERARC